MKFCYLRLSLNEVWELPTRQFYFKSHSQSQSHITTDVQSASTPWCLTQSATFGQRFFFFFSNLLSCLFGVHVHFFLGLVLFGAFDFATFFAFDVSFLPFSEDFFSFFFFFF
jgi:hypothetical protein